LLVEGDALGWSWTILVDFLAGVESLRLGTGLGDVTPCFEVLARVGVRLRVLLRGALVADFSGDFLAGVFFAGVFLAALFAGVLAADFFGDFLDGDGELGFTDFLAADLAAGFLAELLAALAGRGVPGALRGLRSLASGVFAIFNFVSRLSNSEVSYKTQDYSDKAVSLAICPKNGCSTVGRR